MTDRFEMCEACDRVPLRMSRRKLKVAVHALDAWFLCPATFLKSGSDYNSIIKWMPPPPPNNFSDATDSGRDLEEEKAMKTLQNELVDLGAISTETRGIEPVGPRDEDTNEHYLFVGGIAAED